MIFVQLRFISLLILYTITCLREDGNQKRETIDIYDVFLTFLFLTISCDLSFNEDR